MGGFAAREAVCWRGLQEMEMALLDGDRFEGRFRDGVHAVDVSDLKRRMVNEPDFGVTSVTYDFAELLARAEEPR
jgi:hypothetical protein